MSEAVSFAAERRLGTGKGAARAARRAGRVPAILYGAVPEPLGITVDLVALDKQLHTHGFFAKLFEIQVDGQRYPAIVKECQRDPVLGRPLHVDFLAVGASTEIDVDVEVVFINDETCPGIKRGGVLNIVLHAVPLRCRADQIPENIVIDLAERQIGDVIHVTDLTLPAGAKLADPDPEVTVASIAPPMGGAGAEIEPGGEGEGAESVSPASA
ncbi:MAG: 50S ribosomal protein L25/general stress protein Ctc [Rhodospirillales bacterium]|nr:MAG: 50S ribosomal protein L25/general stress protein Ctc [Rhodospirillales bacterium]